MTAPSFRPTGRRLRLALLAGVLAVGVAPIVSSAAPKAEGSSCPSGPKCYSLSIAADPAAPKTAESATYTGTITNLSEGGAGQRLGSANITLPSSFYDVAAGSVSPAGTIGYAAPTVTLRDLGLAPGEAATFTFTARAAESGSASFGSQAKQANDFNGSGNDLTYVGDGLPVVVVASACVVVPEFNSCGESVIEKSAGGSTSTRGLDSDGNPSVVDATLTYAPIDVPAGSRFLSQLHTEVGGAQCPVALSQECDFVVTVDTKFPGDYTIDRNAITLDVACGDLCADSTPRLWFQLDELTGTQELLPPCTPASTAVASPLSGSYACIDGFTVRNITFVNDWKVMSIAVLE